MIWPLMLAGAAFSAIQNNDQQKAQKAQNQFAAEQTRYSPWTGFGMGKQSFGVPSAATALLSGGMQGAATGLAMDQKKLKSPLEAQYLNSPQAYSPYTNMKFNGVA